MAAVGHRVAHGDVVHARANLAHHAGRLNAGHPGQPRRVDAHAAVDVGEVDADGLDIHHRLVGAGGRVRQVNVLHHLRAAVFGNLHRLHGGRFLRSVWSSPVA